MDGCRSANVDGCTSATATVIVSGQSINGGRSCRCGAGSEVLGGGSGGYCTPDE